MSSENKCCKNCKDRTPGCHAECERYMAYRKSLDERREIILSAKRDRAVYRDYAQDRDARWKNRRRKGIRNHER